MKIKFGEPTKGYHTCSTVVSLPSAMTFARIASLGIFTYAVR